MKKIYESLRKDAIKIINFKKKSMKLSTNKQQELYENAKKVAIFVKKNLKISILKIKNLVKLEIIAIIRVNTGVLHIVYVI